jgi:fimbrial isopeptide formation D2 family protein/uncharacterized repeat protein (TIGR01451 family)
VDAGDVVGYQIVYKNEGTTDAFDVVITDDMSLLPFDTVSYVGSSYTGCTSQGAVSSSSGTKLEVTVGQVEVNCQVTISYTAKATTAIAPSQTYTNTAKIQYTSLPGLKGTGSVTPGDTGTTTGERNGAGGAINDYNGTDTAAVTTRIPGMTKTLKTTEQSVAGNDHTQAAIGELVTYELVITVPEGTTPGLKVVDTLQAGLAFVDCVSISASTNVSSSLGSSCNAGTVAGTNDPVISLSGSVATFDFGTVTNTNVGNSGTDTITIQYTAIPLNMNTTPNLQSGSVLKNSAVMTWTGGSQAAVSAANVTIVEPTLGVTKTRTVTGQDAGDITTFSVTVTNGNLSSDTYAYDVVFSDVIPAGLVYVANSATAGVCTAGAPAFGGTTTLTASWASFAKNSMCTFTFDTKLAGDVVPGQTIAANTGELRWTSIPGAGIDRST